jgi:hypothetical protein
VLDSVVSREIVQAERETLTKPGVPAGDDATECEHIRKRGVEAVLCLDCGEDIGVVQILARVWAGRVRVRWCDETCQRSEGGRTCSRDSRASSERGKASASHPPQVLPKDKVPRSSWIRFEWTCRWVDGEEIADED